MDEHKLTATRCVTGYSFVDQICDYKHTSSIEKRLYIPSDLCKRIVNISEYIHKCFFSLSYGMLADFVKIIDCSVLASVVSACQICNFEHTSSLKKEALYAL